MSDTPETELAEYALHLGGLLSNFHSLEFVLRIFLQSQPGARSTGIPYGVDIYSFPVGTDLMESEITSYDSLGQLISKFNAQMKKANRPLIDPTLVEVRDALAHGRVSGAAVGSQLRLLKFDKPSKGVVRVAFNELLTIDWFTIQKKRVLDAISAVIAVLPN